MTREEAIEFGNMWLQINEDCKDSSTYAFFQISIKALEQEPKTGHWIFDDECKEHGHCSRCGYGSVDLVDGESHNFCRNCGAKMVES